MIQKPLFPLINSATPENLSNAWVFITIVPLFQSVNRCFVKQLFKGTVPPKYPLIVRIVILEKRGTESFRIVEM